MKILRTVCTQRLQELVAAFPRLRLAVIGDFFLDKYFDIEPSLGEPSVETGKVAHQVMAIRHSPGVAGTVVGNLAALGAGHLYAIGLTGDDGDAYELRRDLAALGCDTQHLHQVPGRMTCTYLKPQDRTDPSLAGQHSRYDVKNRTVPPLDAQRQVLRSLDALLPQLDAVIVADQAEERDCGVITALVRQGLAEAVRRFPGVVFWADSRRRIHEFRGLIIKPNQYEAVGHENPVPGDEVFLEQVITALPALRSAAGAPVCVTRGPAGMVVADDEITVVPGVRVEGPVDPTGAGDSATAGAVLGLAAGATLPEAALLGNLVASITVQQLATTGTARPEQLFPRLALWQSQQEAVACDTNG
jgi:bifunctional ADP-heptose synthase (sugar kinase/adenylyltransferase)